MLHSLDESLIQQKEFIIKQLKKNPVENFTSYNENIKITGTKNPQTKTNLSTRDVFVKVDSEIVTHRVLEAIENINGKNYSIYLQKSLIENEDLIQTIVAIQLGLLFLLFSGLFLINRNLARVIWKPFYATLDRLKTFRITDNKSLQLPKSNINEFEELNHSLTDLSTNAITLFNAQKEFTENASHELQTPIAIMQGKLELLMQTAPLNTEQANLIGAAYDAGQRMSKLNKTLLLLSKLENNQFLLTDNINVQENVRELVSLYEEVALQKDIQLSFQSSGTTCIDGNKSLFDTMVGNLLNNAIRHSKPQSEVLINVTPGEISICNDAKGTELAKEKLFKRFQKQNSSEQSIGLGLEIASKIALLHKGTIGYLYKNEKHCFTIKFNN